METMFLLEYVGINSNVKHPIFTNKIQFEVTITMCYGGFWLHPD